MGEGPFQSEAIARGLNLRVDNPRHGMLEPAFTSSLDEYEQSLADTADQWLIHPETHRSLESEE
jgi:hypothetical protein